MAGSTPGQPVSLQSQEDVVMAFNGKDVKEEKGSGEREERRNRFARALTRDAFGRHYWDDGKARELRRAAVRDKATKSSSNQSRS